MTTPPKSAEEYIARMRDPVKRAYAAAFWAWLCAGADDRARNAGPEPAKPNGADVHALRKQLWRFRTEADREAYAARMHAEAAAQNAERARLAARPLSEKLKDETHGTLAEQSREALLVALDPKEEGDTSEETVARKDTAVTYIETAITELERRLDEAPDAEDLERLRADEKTVEELSDYLDGETEGPAIIARVTRDAERLAELRTLGASLMGATRALVVSVRLDPTSDEAAEARYALHAIERWTERNPPR